jgi:hypothetical protein
MPGDELGTWIPAIVLFKNRIRAPEDLTELNRIHPRHNLPDNEVDRIQRGGRIHRLDGERNRRTKPGAE